MQLEKCKVCGSEALMVFTDLLVDVQENEYWARCCYCGETSYTLEEIESKTNLIESGSVLAEEYWRKLLAKPEPQMEYVCRCNSCMALLIDENPSERARKVELQEGGKYLRMESSPEVGEDGSFLQWVWVCPNCKSDEFLINLQEE